MDTPPRRLPPAAGKGRPKGALNKVTRERLDVIEQLKRGLFEDPEYLESVMRRIKSGRARPQLELMIWDRVLGKVKDHVRIEHSFDPEAARESVREKVLRFLT